MNEEQKKNLISIYHLILSSPELLLSAAGARNITIRKAYESVIEELHKLENEQGVEKRAS